EDRPAGRGSLAHDRLDSGHEPGDRRGSTALDHRRHCLYRTSAGPPDGRLHRPALADFQLGTAASRGIPRDCRQRDPRAAGDPRFVQRLGGFTAAPNPAATHMTSVIENSSKRFYREWFTTRLTI